MPARARTPSRARTIVSLALFAVFGKKLNMACEMWREGRASGGGRRTRPPLELRAFLAGGEGELEERVLAGVLASVQVVHVQRPGGRESLRGRARGDVAVRGRIDRHVRHLVVLSGAVRATAAGDLVRPGGPVRRGRIRVHADEVDARDRLVERLRVRGREARGTTGAAGIRQAGHAAGDDDVVGVGPGRAGTGPAARCGPVR